jgi:hypothetical protein
MNYDAGSVHIIRHLPLLLIPEIAHPMPFLIAPMMILHNTNVMNTLTCKLEAVSAYL